jgi:hypothetical protein
MTFVEYLDDLVEKAETNVLDYEHFHGNKLANIPGMNPLDSFLYGIASGKLETLKNMRDLVIEMMDRYERP